MTQVHQDARNILLNWQPIDPDQSTLKFAYLEFLDHNVDAVSRECRHGHLTASALVMNPARTHVLLTLHPKVQRWLQLGGHIEPEDASLRDAALREVVEESGIASLWCSPVPLRLDRHAVPCGGDASEHLDVQYLVIADNEQPIQISDESLDLRWFAVQALPDGLAESVLALLRDAGHMWTR